MSSARTLPLESALRTATPQARHQSSGFCSAQPIFGDANGSCSSVADATTRPLLVDDQRARAAGANINAKYVDIGLLMRPYCNPTSAAAPGPSDVF